jgi:hypothetical protein
MWYDRAKIIMFPAENNDASHLSGVVFTLWDEQPAIMDKRGNFPVLVKGEWKLLSATEKFN